MSLQEIKEGDKLYVIGREDLGSSYMSVQAMHAAIQFQHDHPDYAKIWFEKSNYLAYLCVSNESELLVLIEKALIKEIKFSIFREPDIENQITGICLEPGIKSKKLCSNLKLALKQ